MRKKVDNLNSLIPVKEFGLNSNQKTPDPDGFFGEFYQGTDITNSTQILPKN